ncbi:MAG: GNAT family N-acetyltransferase [Beijerinckiaceae bacterium]|nr:GNAT family N-acetyltransferase [Beijerinckiaceae bacterium]
MSLVTYAKETPARSVCETQLITADELAQVRQDWRNLFDASIEANPFFGPDYLEPLVNGALRESAFRALLAWGRDGHGARRLIGFLPLRVAAGPMLPIRGYVHDYVVGTAPLLDADDAERAALALLEGLCAMQSRAMLFLDDVRLDWPAWRTFVDVCRSTGRLVEECDVFERAGLTPASGVSHLKGKISQNLRRSGARLAQMGAWSMTEPTTKAEAFEALESLLAIEASGWKGTEGTALASSPATLAFARAAFSPENQRPQMRFSVLRVDDKPIAVSAHFVAPGVTANLKCAYDESYGACAPGVLLDAAIADGLRREGWTAYLDSVALPGHPVERLWPERLRCGWVAIACDPVIGPTEFHMRVSMKRLHKTMRALAKTAYKSTVRALGRVTGKD